MNRKRRFARKGGVALVGWTKAYLETRKFEPSISVFNPIYRKMNYNNLILILLAEWFKKNVAYCYSIQERLWYVTVILKFRCKKEISRLV